MNPSLNVMPQIREFFPIRATLSQQIAFYLIFRQKQGPGLTTNPPRFSEKKAVTFFSPGCIIPEKKRIKGVFLIYIYLQVNYNSNLGCSSETQRSWTHVRRNGKLLTGFIHSPFTKKQTSKNPTGYKGHMRSRAQFWREHRPPRVRRRGEAANTTSHFLVNTV